MYIITYLAQGASEETPVYRAGDFLGAFDCRRAVYTTGVNSAFSLALTIGQSNPAFDKIEVMQGEFRVYDGSELQFRGRPWRVSRTLDGSMDIEVEGLLSVLSDVEFSGYQFSASGSASITAFLTDLLTRFNPYMATGRTITLGTVSVESPSYSLAITETDPLSAWSVLTDYTVSIFGGYLMPDYSGTDSIGLDYIASLPVSGQNVALAQNLIDLTAELDGSSIITHLFPRGKDGLTISSIENGTYSGIGKQGAYLYNTAARDKYGSIVRYMDFPELETAQEVMDAGLAVMLAQNGKLVESITISAADLSLSSEAFSSFKAGTMVYVSEKLGQDAPYPLTEMSIDLVDLGQSTITLNNPRQTLSGMASGTKSGGSSSGGSVISGVAGVKGAAETAFRTGNVSLSAENVGAVPNTQAGVNAGINLLDTDTQTPVDDDYFVSQAVGGGTTDTSYFRRKLSALWAYIKSKADAAYLSLTGGTLKGILGINSGVLDVSTPPTTGTSGNYIRFGDKNGVTMASVYPYLSASGRVSLILSPRRVKDGTTTTVYNELQLSVNADGTRYVYLSDPAAWLAALGIASKYLSLTGGTLTGPIEIAADGATVKALLRETDDGRGNLQLFGANGAMSVNVYPTANGGRIDLLDASGVIKCSLFVSTGSSGALRLYDADGSSYQNLNFDNITALVDLVRQAEGDPGPDTVPAEGSGRAITSGAMYPAEAAVTALTVTGVAIDGLYAYTVGKMAYVRAQITLSDGGVYTSWTNIASGLPAPIRTVYEQCAARSSTFSKALDVSVSTDGYLRIRYGANNGGWIYFINLCYPMN